VVVFFFLRRSFAHEFGFAHQFGRLHINSVDGGIPTIGTGVQSACSPVVVPLEVSHVTGRPATLPFIRYLLRLFYG
jgi:hypothetical protein